MVLSELSMTIHRSFTYLFIGTNEGNFILVALSEVYNPAEKALVLDSEFS
jgi:hypothetical protein